MTKNFEWRKDEDEGWEEPKPQPERPSRPFRPHPLYFVIVVIVGVVGWLGYRQVQERVEGTAVSLEQQVQASAILLQQAAIEGDDELFRSLSAPGIWEGYAMQQLLGVAPYWQRENFGWQWQATAVATPTVTLSPDLQTAVALMPQTYAVRMPNGVTETVVLSQTAVFRTENGRWLLTLPDDDFWGEEQTIIGDYLTLLFPARDSGIARPIFAELEALIQTACPQITGEFCPKDEQILVRLDSNPFLLYAFSDPPFYWDRVQPIRLPAPTLLGTPTDNHSLHIVNSTYASQIVRLWLPTLLGWQEDYPAFYSILREQMLLEMGLQPNRHLLPSFNNDEALAKAGTLQEISALWSLERETIDSTLQWNIDSSQFAALLAFLRVRGETTASLHNRLVTTESFWEWSNINPADGVVEREWLQFLYNRSSYASQSAPIPLPSSDIRLLCGDDLLRYDLAAHTWRSERPFNRTLIDVVPEDGGLLVAGTFFDEATGENHDKAFLWQNDREKYLIEWRTGADFPLQSLQRHDPLGRKLVLMVRELFGPPILYLLDIDACGEDSCPLPLLSGFPVWSPDGRYTLIAPSDANQPDHLWLGDSAAHLLVELETGYAPFWLDNETYGYVRIGNTGYSQAVIANLSDNEPRVIATVEGLLNQSPGPDSLLSMAITAVQPNPANPKQMFITVLAGDPVEMSIFGLAIADDNTIETTRILNDWEDARITLSTDGRDQIIDKTNAATHLRTITIAPVNNRQQELFTFTADHTTTYDWTADSQWLLLNTPNHLKLIAPNHDYQQLIFHDFKGCYEAQWVK